VVLGHYVARCAVLYLPEETFEMKKFFNPSAGKAEIEAEAVLKNC
jgi:hypothetical protein